jgi:hypothetical protein
MENLVHIMMKHVIAFEENVGRYAFNMMNYILLV